MNILKDLSEDVIMSYGRLATMEKHLHRLAEGCTNQHVPYSIINHPKAPDAPKVINATIQTDKPRQNSFSIQTLPQKSIKVFKNNQATATDNGYNMQKLNENYVDFIHRRLIDYLIRNTENNESINQSVNPLTRKVVSPNLTQKTPKSQTPKVVSPNLALKTPKSQTPKVVANLTKKT